MQPTQPVQPIDWIYADAALASGIAAVAAWIAKIRWSREYATAKEAQIETLNAQIDALERLSPMKIQEYFDSVKTQLEGFNDFLERQLEEAHAEIEEKKNLISQLELAGEEQSIELEEAIAEKEEIEKTTAQLEDQLSRAESAPPVQIRVPSISTGTYEQLAQSSTALQRAMGRDPPVMLRGSHLGSHLGPQYPEAWFRAATIAALAAGRFVVPEEEEEKEDEEQEPEDADE